MTLHSSQIGTGTATAALKSTTEHKKSTSTSFSKALKDASTTATDTSTSAAKAPAGEKTTAVEGHKYADITAGPRPTHTAISTTVSRNSMTMLARSK